MEALPSDHWAASASPGRDVSDARRGQIELFVRNVEQLFNTMDPSPFHERDLDHDAEQFILSWAEEYHLKEPVELVVYIENYQPQGNPAGLITQAVHHYFGYHARLNDLEFRRLMKQGRASLLVGLVFLAACFGAIEVFDLNQADAPASFLSEGLTIAGWVAMWKPMQIYLYDWWPLRRRGRIFRKLERMPVSVRPRKKQA